MNSQIYDPAVDKFFLPELPYKYGGVEGISADTDKFHHDKHFNAYITGLNDVDSKLEAMRAGEDFSAIRSTLLSFSHNASGAYLHQVYYDVMGGDGKVDESLDVVKKIVEDFGSIEVWEKEFRAVAGAARGWAVLGLFKPDGKLRHALVDFHDTYVPWGMQPVLVIDMWEHAYYYDNGPEKGKYIDAFMKAIKWEGVNEYYVSSSK